jgi:hypothetical protein
MLVALVWVELFQSKYPSPGYPDVETALAM